jgi:hypothetical protein
MAGTVTISTAIDRTAGQERVAPALAPAPAARRQPARVTGTLAVLDEPLGLLAELRSGAKDRPAAARATAPGLLADRAIALWRDQLGALGIPPEVVRHAFETCRREIWLWVDGDRRWEQLATHLALRVVRRA